MANEIRQFYPTGYTLYAVIRNTSGQVWYPTGEAFETWGTGARTAADYDIALTEYQGSYIGDFDSSVDAGRYDVQVFLQSGGAPADTDNMVGVTQIVWSGSASVGAGEVGAAITVAQAKEHLRITHSDDDDYIEAITLAASEWCEEFQRRVYIQREVVDYLDEFPTVIRPSKSPLVSVTSLKYYDTDGSQQTYSSSNYRVDINTEPGRITEAYNTNWPDIRQMTNSITLTYQAGYAARADIPEEIKHAVKLLVGHLYENREDVTSLNMMNVPMGVKSLLSIKRIYP